MLQEQCRLSFEICYRLNRYDTTVEYRLATDSDDSNFSFAMFFLEYYMPSASVLSFLLLDFSCDVTRGSQVSE